MRKSLSYVLDEVRRTRVMPAGDLRKLLSDRSLRERDAVQSELVYE
jgi:hypothetical protein